jgi:ParB family chromosome partitioning protein
MLVALRQSEETQTEQYSMQFREHPAVQGKRDFYPVDPRKLRIDVDYNVREMDSKETREHIAALKASIIANGVKVPLEVRLAADDKIYIVAGHCRHAAVMEAIKDGHPIETVPCIPEGKGTSEIDRVVNLIVSNSGKPLAPLEVAAVVKRLDGFGWSTKQIAERLGWKSSASVKQHLDMLAMPEAVKDHVRKGDISATTARNLAKSDLSPEEQRKLIADNLEENARIKGKRGRVTPKTIARDKPKPMPQASSSDLPTLAVNRVIPEATSVFVDSEGRQCASIGVLGTLNDTSQVTDDRTASETVPDQALIESTREKVAEANEWHPDAEAPEQPRSAIAELFQAIKPFVDAVNLWDLNAVSDEDDVPIEITGEQAKKLSRLYAERTGGSE